jgi:hypothetical protein
MVGLMSGGPSGRSERRGYIRCRIVGHFVEWSPFAKFVDRPSPIIGGTVTVYCGCESTNQVTKPNFA